MQNRVPRRGGRGGWR